MKKKDDAMRLGAHHFYAASDLETFKLLQGKFHLILNTVSADLDINQYINLLKVDGTFVVLGLPEKKVDPSIAMAPLIVKRKSVAGSLIGSIKETQEMLDFCGAHNITCDIELISAQKINEAYDRVLSSDVRYRFVIDAKSFLE